MITPYSCLRFGIIGYDVSGYGESTTKQQERLAKVYRPDGRGMREQMATKSDFPQMATKTDLAQLEARLVTRLEAGTTAVRGDMERVHLRLDTIERALSARLAQIETDLVRLRTIVYLLVKGKRELLPRRVAGF